jgi:type I restriction enzyme S subunit
MYAVSERLGLIDKPEVRPFQSVARGYSYFQEGDVLFAKITPCMQNGKHALAEKLIDGIGFGSTEFHVLRPGKLVDREWLLYYLRQDEVLLGAQQSFTGSVGLQRVPENFLSNLRIPLPSLEAQHQSVAKIRKILEYSRTAIDALEMQLNAASRLAPAFLQEVFGDIAPISIASRRPTNGTWRIARVLDLARLESGHTPSRRHPEWWGGAVPWLALPDIRKLHGKHAYETIEYTNDAGLANSAARLLPVGAVCLCRDASIGFVTILGRPMATSQHFANWICDPEKLDPEFLLYSLMASHNYLRDLGSGSVIKTIYMQTIESFQICAPEIGEQRRISRTLRQRLETAETLSESLKARLAELGRLPQRLLTAAFS